MPSAKIELMDRFNCYGSAFNVPLPPPCPCNHPPLPDTQMQQNGWSSPHPSYALAPPRSRFRSCMRNKAPPHHSPCGPLANRQASRTLHTHPPCMCSDSPTQISQPRDPKYKFQSFVNEDSPSPLKWSTNTRKRTQTSRWGSHPGPDFGAASERMPSPKASRARL